MRNHNRNAEFRCIFHFGRFTWEETVKNAA